MQEGLAKPFRGSLYTEQPLHFYIRKLMYTTKIYDVIIIFNISFYFVIHSFSSVYFGKLLDFWRWFLINYEYLLLLFLLHYEQADCDLCFLQCIWRCVNILNVLQAQFRLNLTGVVNLFGFRKCTHHSVSLCCCKHQFF